MRHILLVLALLIPNAARAENPPGQSTKVIVVRHAEKDGAGDDAHLTRAGVERANALAHALEAAGVKAIFATGPARTIDTAKPLADKLKLPVKEVGDPAKLATEITGISTKDPGCTILVVGRTTNIRQIIKAMGATDAVADEASAGIRVERYDEMLVCTLQNGSVSVLRLRYGAATPGGDGMKMQTQK
jgi:phosphohistidine phosphatase SixA